MFQSDRLSMIGLGSDGSEPTFDAGIHLRWHASHALGFPEFGFDLYRRQHAAAKFECLDLARRDARTAALRPTVALSYRSSWGPDARPALVAARTGRLTISTGTPWREFKVIALHRTGTMTIRASADGALVAQERPRASASAVTTIIRADRFDTVTIEWTGGIGFHALCWVPLPADERPDLTWSLLGSFTLPATKPDALARISYPPPPTGKNYGRAWDPMHRMIGLIPAGPATYVSRTGSDPKPSFVVDPVDTLNLMALVDTGLARMMGLYYIDTKAAAGTSYDYMIVGRWTAAPAGDERWVCYGLKTGRPPAVPVPTGLAITPKKQLGASSTTQTGCALTWDTQSAAATLASRTPVFFNVSRQSKSGRRWGPATILTRNRPILIASNHGAPPSAFYTDGPLADGEYRYRVSGVDLFGRESRASAAATLALADLVAPPPPTDVKAKLDDSTMDVAVRWQWPAHRREMAGDASEFRVYWQTGDIAPEQLHLTSVSDLGDTSDCVTDLDSTADWSRFSDGWLVNRGRRFRVTAVAVSGGKVHVTVQNIAATTEPARARQVPTGVSARGYSGFLLYTPAPGDLPGRGLLVVDWSRPARWNASYAAVPVSAADAYAKTLTALPVTVTASSPVAYALIGVGTVDATGNVGAVSTPVMVSARQTGTPSTPDAPWTEMPLGDNYATYADWYGRSRFTLGFSTAPDLYYVVMRATDAALVYAEYGRERRVDDVDDTELAALAGTHDAAFASIGAKDAGGGPIVDDGSGARTCEDSFPGKGRNRYVYRIACSDRAGNRSAMSDPLVVRLHDVLRPNAPRIAKINGGENEVTVTWAPVTSHGVVGYELYRSDSAAAAADYRDMTLLKDSEADTYTAAAADVSSFAFTDRTVTAGTRYWYAAIAVKVTDEGLTLRSPLSRAVTAQPYNLMKPVPPAFDESASTWADVDGAPVITLSWSAGSEQDVYQLQRKREDESSWSVVLDWGAGTGDGAARSHVDTAVNQTYGYSYRIKAKSIAGMLSASWGEVDVDAPS